MKAAKILISILAGLLLAAIGYGRLLTAIIRSAEATALVDTHRVIAAEQTYASANGGYFDHISRLCRRGPDCLGIGIPDYPEDKPAFLEPELARPTPYRKDHYIRDWQAYGELETVPEGISPTSVEDYCYSATPGNWLVRYGRSFSGVSAGHIAEDFDGAPIPCDPYYIPPVME